MNGFSDDVSLSLSGLSGAQATWSFSPPIVTGGSGGSQLSVTTAAALPPGSYPLDITASGSAITHHANVTLVVPAPPDFTLAAAPPSLTVPAGGSGLYSVSVGSLNGFAGSVSLSLAGLPPSGVSGTFSPAAVVGAGSSTLTVTTTPGSAPGTFPLTITGTSGSIAHTAAVTLVVVSVPDFGLTVTPGSQTVTRGQSTTYSVSVTSTGGFTGSVSLYVTGVPSGASASFSKKSVVPPGTSTLTIRTGRSTKLGTFTLQITGKKGALIHQATATLVVNPVVRQLSHRN